MYRHFPAIALCIALLLPGGTATAADNVERDVIRFREDMYGQIKNDDLMYAEYLALSGRIIEEGTSEHYFAAAQLEYYMGRAFQSFDDSETVIAHYLDTRAGKYFSLRTYYTRADAAMDHYERALALLAEHGPKEGTGAGRESAETFRLRGEIIGQMILLGDTGFLLKYGPESRKNIRRALRLDPNNAKALILAAGEKIYTPVFFGGKPEEGIALLREISGRGNIDGEDLFNIYSGIGYGYAALDRWGEAETWFASALEIYPRNAFASGMLLLSRNGGNP